MNNTYFKEKPTFLRLWRKSMPTSGPEYEIACMTLLPKYLFNDRENHSK